MESAPYDPFSFLTQLTIFFTTLSPVIEQWVKERTELRQQRIMMERVRHLKHYCKRQNLSANGILIEIKLTFKDYTDIEQTELATLMDEELHK